MSESASIDHFKCDVRRFDTIDNEIRTINEKLKPLQTRLKELKNTKKSLENTICSFMETNEMNVNIRKIYKESEMCTIIKRKYKTKFS